MALKIRLRRTGRKKAPTYRIVVAESSMPRDGRFVANLGHYNPRTEPATIKVDLERSREWLERGAIPTDTVASLLKQATAAGGYTGPPRPEQGAAPATVRSAATQVAETVRDAAETVVEQVKHVAEAVVEAVTGEEEEPEAAPPANETGAA